MLLQTMLILSALIPTFGLALSYTLKARNVSRRRWVFFTLLYGSTVITCTLSQELLVESVLMFATLMTFLVCPLSAGLFMFREIELCRRDKQRPQRIGRFAGALGTAVISFALLLVTIEVDSEQRWNKFYGSQGSAITDGQLSLVIGKVLDIDYLRPNGTCEVVLRNAQTPEVGFIFEIPDAGGTFPYLEAPMDFKARQLTLGDNIAVVMKRETVRNATETRFVANANNVQYLGAYEYSRQDSEGRTVEGVAKVMPDHPDFKRLLRWGSYENLN